MWITSTLQLLMVAMVFCSCQELGVEHEPVETIFSAFRHPPPSTPAPWTYVLTCYGGSNDSSAYLGTPACGGKKVDGKWWYSTGAYSFGCGSKLELQANGKCVVVTVVDNGPAGWVEDNAKQKCKSADFSTGYILDTSPLVTQELFGKSCAGWSECLKIKVREVDKSTPEGKCTPALTTECEYNDGKNFRRCEDCGAEVCQSDGTWSKTCEPRPDLYPCADGFTCQIDNRCIQKGTTLDGSVDPLDCKYFRGWALDMSDRSLELPVKVYIDSSPDDATPTVYTGKANLPRSEGCHTISDCQNGFEIPVPAELSDRQKHLMRVFAFASEEGKGAELHGSPYYFACSDEGPLPVDQLSPDKNTLEGGCSLSASGDAFLFLVLCGALFCFLALWRNLRRFN